MIFKKKKSNPAKKIILKPEEKNPEPEKIILKPKPAEKNPEPNPAEKTPEKT